MSTGQEEVVDGARMVFQMVPDSEAPAEMHLYLPDLHALCTAENATHVHNILTLRGAQVRDAHELRHGTGGTPASAAGADVLAQLTPDQLFDALAVRVNGPCCWDHHLVLEVDLTDTGTRYRLELRNGVLTHTVAPRSVVHADAVLHLPAGALPKIAGAAADPAALAAASVAVDVDATAMGRLPAALGSPDPGFSVVTP